MKIYIAGTPVSAPDEEPKLADIFMKIGKLHSFFHCVDGFEKKWFMKNIKNRVELFLDSGAFSAKKQKKEIDVHDYIKFIKKHIDKIDVYANLDVIGCPEKTRKNQEIMEKHGLTPIPVYHYGEDPEVYLRPLIERYDYIAIGGLVISQNKKLITWLDNIFMKYILDENGYPKVKVHAFGLTTFSLMFRYPWYSVDSTTWVMNSRVGNLIIPRLVHGKWRHDIPPYKIPISTTSPRIKEARQHIQTLSIKERNVLLRYLDEKGYKLGHSTFRLEPQTYELKENEKWGGKKPKDKNKKRMVETIVEEGLSNMYQLRDEINVIYYIDVEKCFSKYPRQFKYMNHQKSLFLQ